MKIEYNDYERLINNFCRCYASKTKIEYEDLKSEANLIFCKALGTYRSERASFSTYLCMQLTKLSHFYAKEKNRGMVDKHTRFTKGYKPDRAKSIGFAPMPYEVIHCEEQDQFSSDFVKLLRPDERKLFVLIYHGVGSKPKHFGISKYHRTWRGLQQKYLQYNEVTI